MLFTLWKSEIAMEAYLSHSGSTAACVCGGAWVGAWIGACGATEGGVVSLTVVAAVVEAAVEETGGTVTFVSAAVVAEVPALITYVETDTLLLVAGYVLL